jgi:serine/threonine protein kinase/tetratricopeptide (TPR) repeat protein
MSLPPPLSLLGVSDEDMSFVRDAVQARLFPPDAIGRFRNLRKLGAGSMGVVFRADDPKLARSVAIKLLHEQNKEGRERLRREAQAMAKLVNANVVQVYETGVHRGQVYLVMEYVEGCTLDVWLDRQPRTWRVMCELFYKIGKGVAAAHAAGLVHRDLKPCNILVGRDGEPKVADFGLAQMDGGQWCLEDAATEPETLVTASRLTRDGRFVGTRHYSAPEQDDAGVAGAASDQFSFCVMLWEELYSEYPFQGSTDEEVSRAKATGAIRTPPRAARVPARIRRALVRGLHPDPGGRWCDMNELIAELTREPWRRRHPWIFTVIGLLAPAMIGLLSVMSPPPGQACRLKASERMDRLRPAINQIRGNADGGDGVFVSRLGEYANEWTATAKTICSSSAQPESTTKTPIELIAMGTCLERRYISFAALVENLSTIPRHRQEQELAHAIHEKSIRLDPTLESSLWLPPISSCTMNNGHDPSRSANLLGSIEISHVMRDDLQAIARIHALAAQSHHDAALDAIERHLPSFRARSDHEAIAEVALIKGRVLRRARELRQAESALLDAEAAAERAWRDDLLAATRLERAKHALELLEVKGKPRRLWLREAEVYLLAADRLLGRLPVDSPLRIEAMLLDALIAEKQGEPEWAVDRRERVLERVARHKRRESTRTLVYFLAQFADSHAASGAHDRALAYDEEALKLAGSLLSADDLLTGHVAFNAAIRMFDRGDPQRGQEALDLSLRTFTRVFGPVSAPVLGVHYAAGSLLYYAGDSPSARQHAAQARVLATRLGSAKEGAFAAYLLSALELRAGRPDVALRHAADAVSMFNALPPREDDPCWQLSLQAGLVEALAATERTNEALRLAVTVRRDSDQCHDEEASSSRSEVGLAIALAQERAGRPELAREELLRQLGGPLLAGLEPFKAAEAHALAARLLARDEPETARRHVQSARTLFTELRTDGARRLAERTWWPNFGNESDRSGFPTRTEISEQATP